MIQKQTLQTSEELAVVHRQLQAYPNLLTWLLGCPVKEEWKGHSQTPLTQMSDDSDEETSSSIHSGLYI